LAAFSDNLLKNKYKQETIDGNEYLDKKVYVKAGGSLQERVQVLGIEHSATKT
jgi:hypothetical protein